MVTIAQWLNQVCVSMFSSCYLAASLYDFIYAINIAHGTYLCLVVDFVVVVVVPG